MATKIEQYKRLLAIAEAGLFYGKDPFDEERYQELKSIALSLLSNGEKEIEEQLAFILDQNEGYPHQKSMCVPSSNKRIRYC